MRILLIIFTIGICSCGLPQKHQVLGTRGNWDVVNTAQKESLAPNNRNSNIRKDLSYSKIDGFQKTEKISNSVQNYSLALDSILTIACAAPNTSVQTNASLRVESKHQNALLGLKNIRNVEIAKWVHSNKKQANPFENFRINHKKLNAKPLISQSLVRTLLKNNSNRSLSSEEDATEWVLAGMLVLFLGTILILGLTSFGKMSLYLFTDISLILAAALSIITLIVGDEDNAFYVINLVLSSIYLGIMGLVGLLLLFDETLGLDSVWGMWGLFFGVAVFMMLVYLYAEATY